jgi:hypothetical protein
MALQRLQSALNSTVTKTVEKKFLSGYPLPAGATVINNDGKTVTCKIEQVAPVFSESEKAEVESLLKDFPPEFLIGEKSDYDFEELLEDNKKVSHLVEKIQKFFSTIKPTPPTPPTPEPSPEHYYFAGKIYLREISAGRTQCGNFEGKDTAYNYHYRYEEEIAPCTGQDFEYLARWNRHLEYEKNENERKEGIRLAKVEVKNRIIAMMLPEGDIAVVIDKPKAIFRNYYGLSLTINKDSADGFLKLEIPTNLEGKKTIRAYGKNDAYIDLTIEKARLGYNIDVA